MVVYKPTALLILFGICAVRANVILPRKHVLDFVTFRDNVRVFISINYIVDSEINVHYIKMNKICVFTHEMI